MECKSGFIRKIQALCLLLVAAVSMAACAALPFGETQPQISSYENPIVTTYAEKELGQENGHLPYREELSKDSLELEYTSMDELFDNLIDYYEMPIGDFGFGEGNNHYRYKEKIDPTSPIFQIYINPYATEEIIDEYVATVLIMDRFLNTNREYLRYLQKNDPYFVTLRCRDVEMMQISLDGTWGERDQELKERIEENLVDLKELTELELMDFRDFLQENVNKSSGDICLRQAPDGEYYYVIDDGNVTKSLEKIMKSAAAVAAADPFTREEISHYVDSIRQMGNGPMDGTYTLYIGKYGGETAQRKTNRPQGPMWFSDNASWIFGRVYEHYLPEDDIEAMDPDFNLYDRSYLDEDGTYDHELNVERARHSDGNFKKKDLIEKLYPLYDRIAKAQTEHGITKPEVLNLYVSVPSAESEGKYTWHCDFDLPVTKRLTKAVFVQTMEKQLEEIDPGPYELQD